jgi:hypothetical protein
MSLVQIFLSSVTAEYGEHRRELANYFRGARLHAQLQEEFIPGPYGTLAKLNSYVHACTYLVHIVGDNPGAPVPREQVRDFLAAYPGFAERLPQLGDMLDAAASYTQWEAYLAHFWGKGLIVARPDKAGQPDASQSAHLARLHAMHRYREVVFDDAKSLAIAVYQVLVDELLQQRPQPAQPFALYAGGGTPVQRQFKPIVPYILDRLRQTQGLVAGVGAGLQRGAARAPIALIVPGPSEEGPDKFLEVIKERAGNARWIVAEFSRAVAFTLRETQLAVSSAEIEGAVSPRDVQACVVDICSKLGIAGAARHRDRPDELHRLVAGYLSDHKDYDIVLQTVAMHTGSWSAKDEALLEGVLRWLGGVRIPDGAAHLAVVIGICEDRQSTSGPFWNRQLALDNCVSRLAERGIPGVDLVRLDWLRNVQRQHLKDWRDEVLVDVVPDDEDEREAIYAAACAWHDRQQSHPLKTVGGSLARMIRDRDFRKQFASD